MESLLHFFSPFSPSLELSSNFGRDHGVFPVSDNCQIISGVAVVVFKRVNRLEQRFTRVGKVKKSANHSKEASCSLVVPRG